MTSLDPIFGLDEALETQRREHDLPALSAAVVVDGELVQTAACGTADLATERPASPDDVYPIGSVTKVFVATMLMQLVEAGTVSLYDPVHTYIPEYRVTSPFPTTPPTTLRQLASHTAGLPRDAGINFRMNRSMGAWSASRGEEPLSWYAPMDNVLASLANVELELPPDTAKSYSNLGFALLGLALERAAGQDIRDYMAEHVFRPLGMDSAGWVDDARAWDARFATGYARPAPGAPPFVTPPWKIGSALYSGGITCTAADLAKFVAATMPDVTRAPHRILTRESLLRMCHPLAQGDATLGWGKGWHAGYANYGHAGAHVGYNAATLVVPALKLGVVAITNQYNPVLFENHALEVVQQLIEQIAPALAEQQAAASGAAQVDLDRYVGDYELPGGYATIEIRRQGDRLRFVLREEARPPVAMLLAPMGPHQFGEPESGWPAAIFDVDPEGRVHAVDHVLFRFKRCPAPTTD